jgi:hypothetical protein
MMVAVHHVQEEELCVRLDDLVIPSVDPNHHDKQHSYPNFVFHHEPAYQKEDARIK